MTKEKYCDNDIPCEYCTDYECPNYKSCRKTIGYTRICGKRYKIVSDVDGVHVEPVELIR